MSSIKANEKQMSKQTTSGRSVVKPKKYRTTSSDEQTKVLKKRKLNVMEQMQKFLSHVVDDNADNDQIDISLGNTSPNDDSLTDISSNSSDDDQSYAEKTSVDVNNLLNKNLEQPPENQQNSSKGSANIADGNSAISVQKIVGPTTGMKEPSQSTSAGTSEMIEEPPLTEHVNIVLNRFLQAFENRIFEKINKLETNMNAKFEEMQEKINQQQHVQASFVVPDGFPLKTLEEFEAFEANPALQEQLKSYFLWWGGGDVKDNVRQFLKDALSDEASIYFSWQRSSGNGRNENNAEAVGQRSLYRTQLSKIIYSVIKQKSPDATIKDFSVAMQEALRTSKQRNRDRTRRHRQRQDNGGNPLDQLQEFYEN